MKHRSMLTVFIAISLGACNTVTLAQGDCTDYVDLTDYELPIAVSGSTTNAGADFTPFDSSSIEPDCWQGSWSWGCGFGPDVTYKWTAPDNACYTFSIDDSDFDAVLLIYAFTCPVEPVYPEDFICGSNDVDITGYHASVRYLELAEGDEVLVVVDGFGMQSGGFDLAIFDPTAEVAVYADGSGIEGTTAIEHFLDWKGVTHRRIDHFDVNFADLSDFYEAILFPGGWSVTYDNDIDPTGDQHIRDLVDGGGAYIGICAGAYFAAEQGVWEGEDEDHPLDLFNGTVVGSLHEIIPWPGYTMTSVTLNPDNPINQFEPEAHTTLYQGGPAFFPHEGVEVETIATYDGYYDERAIINFTYGNGRVLLIGPHPEFEEDSDRDGTTFADELDDEGSEWGLLWSAFDWVLGRPITSPTAVPWEIAAPALSSITLYPNHPNPFNPQTTITFTLARPQQAELAVYDLTGRLLGVLADSAYEVGNHSVVWNGRDAMGREVPSGTYIVRLETESGVEARKVALIR